MSPELDDLLKKAMARPPEDRAAMANSLLESLDGTEDEDVETAWDNEIKSFDNSPKNFLTLSAGSRIARRPEQQMVRETRPAQLRIVSHPGSPPMLEDSTIPPRKSRRRQH